MGRFIVEYIDLTPFLLFSEVVLAAWVVEDPAILEGYREDASGLIGSPKGVARPRTVQEICEIVEYCHNNKIPLTPIGGQTSTTGSSICEDGWLLASEKLRSIIEIDEKRRIAIVEPGLYLGDFRREVAKVGLLFPPDPTSENEATMGGIVMTNASGPRTLRYGTTRNYISSLEVVLPPGKMCRFNRYHQGKDTTGYFGVRDFLNLLIGSEGTLGIVTQITVKLLPAERPILGIMTFFSTMQKALSWVVDVRKDKTLSPLSIELFDRISLDAIGAHQAMAIPAEYEAAIYIEVESIDNNQESVLAPWENGLRQAGALVEDTFIAGNSADQKILRDIRHAIPLAMNEEGRRFRETGGGKLSTDFAVPYAKLPELFQKAEEICASAGIDFVARYGHIGNGHPHYNFLPKNSDEKRKTEEVIMNLCRLAVSLGGTVAAEHGIGKIKRPYFELQYPDVIKNVMRAVKESIDPSGILAPGNIFHAKP